MKFYDEVGILFIGFPALLNLFLAIKDVKNRFERGGDYMTYRVNTIAKWFVENTMTSGENSYDGNLTLNKLIYFADMMNYTINHEKLVDEQPIGYTNGPVYQSIYIDHKYGSLSSIKSDNGKISSETLNLLKIIKFAFGTYSSQYLTDLTHEQSPWKNRKEDCEKSDYNPRLNFEDLTEIEKARVRDIYDIYRQIDLDKYIVSRIGDNVFVYDESMVLDEGDYKELEGLEGEEDSIFVEKIDGELIYA